MSSMEQEISRLTLRKAVLRKAVSFNCFSAGFCASPRFGSEANARLTRLARTGLWESGFPLRLDELLTDRVQGAGTRELVLVE